MVKSSRFPGNSRVGWGRKDPGVRLAHIPLGTISAWQA